MRANLIKSHQPTRKSPKKIKTKPAFGRKSSISAADLNSPDEDVNHFDDELSSFWFAVNKSLKEQGEAFQKKPKKQREVSFIPSPLAL
tara:strand:- start:115 stop:378 length:264 start_codon:yes stop_codon:yes gene_type:complete